MACGSGVKKGALVDEMNLIDEAPTIAEIMGLKLNNTDGKVIKEFIEDK